MCTIESTVVPGSAFLFSPVCRYINVLMGDARAGASVRFYEANIDNEPRRDTNQRHKVCRKYLKRPDELTKEDTSEKEIGSFIKH
jgi:hypothetical protein